MVEAGWVIYNNHKVTILIGCAGKFAYDIENRRYTDDGMLIEPYVLYGYGGFETKEAAIQHAKTWIDPYKK
ncbi:hypothetical protein [Legionella feeleii]|uniref:Uncharacterized protein n=1 Tax=Legionella feeleii TaxID=453 RepID=A0A0W0TQM9_9GAMM|nr:hypothetical protein [Legionella feeleii]KTC97921.1 hypothetical protein Lfee_1526 [Legionella feeleii]SPX62021.1 Uncharacterised protein [Legionella feeleii]